MTAPFNPGQLLHAQHLRLAGISPDVARDDEGLLQYVRVRRGIWIRGTVWRALDPDERYAALVHATARTASGPQPLVFSHQSAAAVWGMPLIGDPGPRLHVLVRPDGGGSSGSLMRHRGELPKALIINGVHVTDAARTVTDLARSASMAAALAAADSALHRNLCTRAQLVQEAAALPLRARGRARAALIAALADGRAESAGESLSRAQMYVLRFPQPDLQVEKRDGRGVIGRADFGWEGLLGEFDGAVKYGIRLNQSPAEMQQAIVAEKEREDRLRAAEGERMARWLWADAWGGVGMARKLAAQGLRPLSRQPWVQMPVPSWPLLPAKRRRAA